MSQRIHADEKRVPWDSFFVVVQPVLDYGFNGKRLKAVLPQRMHGTISVAWL